jgi:hypothetical protein
MIRIVLDINNTGDDLLATKEAVAMALEKFGSVRVVSITTDGRDKR